MLTDDADESEGAEEVTKGQLDVGQDYREVRSGDNLRTYDAEPGHLFFVDKSADGKTVKTLEVLFSVY